MPKKKQHSEWVITKGQRSRWQKEQKRRRIVIIISSVIISIVLGLVIYAIYDSQVAPYSKTVLKVNDKSFDMNDYIDMLQLNGIRVISPELQADIAGTVLHDIMPASEKYRQISAELGLAVTEEEIEEKVQEQIDLLGPSDDNSDETQPTPSDEDLREIFLDSLDTRGTSEKEFREQIAAALLRVKLQEHIGDTEVPAEMPQVHIRGLLIDAGTEAATAAPDTTGTPSATVTPDEITSPVTSGTSAANNEIIKANAEEIYNTIKERLDDGEEFAILVEEFSITSYDPELEVGDLGWMPEEIAILYGGEEFASEAFGLELDTLSSPIPTIANTQFWIIEVIEKEESKVLEESTETYLRSKAFDDWFTEKSNDFTIKDDYLDAEDIAWAIEKAL